MEGKLIWILCNNCLYCSEVRVICIGPASEFVYIQANPIIGSISLIIITEPDKDPYVSEGHIYEGNDVIGKLAKLSFDFDKLCSLINYEKEI